MIGFAQRRLKQKQHTGEACLLILEVDTQRKGGELRGDAAVPLPWPIFLLLLLLVVHAVRLSALV